jgi:hypothetical protein
MMIDRNKVIEALECCQNKVSHCEECPFKDTGTANTPCINWLMRDARCLLEHEQETPQPVRESTSDFVRFTQDKNEIIIRRDQITYALYDSTEDKTYVYIAGEKTCYVYRKNILDLITGGE